MPQIGRFAPSPTSDLHLGNLRTALAAWLLARSGGGSFLVRVEDLDQARVKAAPGVAARQLADLARLGLDWDGEVVWQSQRLDRYAAAVSALGDRVYPCFCTRREIAEAASAPHDGYRAYPGTCASLSSAQRSERALTRTPALRVRAEGASFTVTDVHAGQVTGVVDDFVLVRGDGTFAYNLAVVTDDAAQGVTQVCRGDDLLASAPRQAWLARQLGYPVPTYAHVSLVLNRHGQRLAKRDGAVTLADLGAAGQDPAAVCGWLCASLGLPGAATPAEALANLPADFTGTPQWWRPVTME
ncbi:MAG: tRNA glutamyl-Q(34) synthetase GluQRS [Propionibacteriaceae bacterium]|nr:tRNA glutamyl-Q(34) synthetase GluQRS [Propionibacteriaceae bacterium]